jgi:hypothetical protein
VCNIRVFLFKEDCLKQQEQQEQEQELNFFLISFLLSRSLENHHHRRQELPAAALVSRSFEKHKITQAACLQDGSSHRSTNACDEFRQKISSL